MKMFELPSLPYALDALAPYISQETLEYHYGKHHQAYVTNLNNMIQGSDCVNMPIEDIIEREKEGALFNNAAQTYNHTFYWHCLAPYANANNVPTGDLAFALDEAFGDFESFKTQMTEIAVKHFGSGWAWLLKDARTGKLGVKGMHDAGTPIADGDKPLLALDVWEHAYYIDYRNKRPDYVDAFWKLVNWEFVADQLSRDGVEPLMIPVQSS